MGGRGENCKAQPNASGISVKQESPLLDFLEETTQVCIYLSHISWSVTEDNSLTILEVMMAINSTPEITGCSTRRGRR